jgi:hypothetical protein
MSSGQGRIGREPRPGPAAPATPAIPAAPAADDLPGDPACWLRRVCPACGNVAPTDPPVTCPNCHTEITGN